MDTLFPWQHQVCRIGFCKPITADEEWQGAIHRSKLMQIDPALQSSADNYKLITNLVLPRPIAWITSLNAHGVVNLAPFSFFNAVGSDPLYLTRGCPVKSALC
jgi:hypothetical protein